MATRFSSPVVRRAQVPLTQEDLTALDQFISAGAAQREVLACHGLVPSTGDLAESTVIHALLVMGLKAVQDRRDELGYAQLSQDPEYVKHTARARGNRGLRRRPRHADDA